MQKHQLSLHLSLPGAHLPAWLPLSCYALCLATTTYTLGISQQLLVSLEGVSSNINNEVRIGTGVSIYLSSAVYWILMLAHFLVFTFLVWASATSGEHSADPNSQPVSNGSDDSSTITTNDVKSFAPESHHNDTQLVTGLPTPIQESKHNLAHISGPLQDHDENMEPDSPQCCISRKALSASLRRDDLSMFSVGVSPHFPLIPPSVKSALRRQKVYQVAQFITETTNRDTAEFYKQLLGYLIIHDLHISLGFFLERVRHRDVYLVRYRPDIGEYIRFALEADFNETIAILNKHLPGMTQACIEAFAEDAVMMDSVSRLKSVLQYLTKDQYFIRRNILRSAFNNSTGALLLLEKKNIAFGQTDLQDLLLNAIRNKSEALVRHWLDRGAKTRLQGSSETPLWTAARCGNAATMSMLLDIDEEPFQKSSVRDRLLVVALKARNLSVVDVLIYAGANELLVPLETAVTAGHADLVDKILAHQAKNKGWIPPAPSLQLACVYGHLEIARALVNHGSKLDPNIPMALGGGNSPLMGAVSSNHPEIVKYLISRGASFDASGVFGNALQTAAFWNYHDVAVVLLQKKFEVDARAEPLPSALAIALRRGNLDIVTLLLQHRASTKGLESYDRLLCGYRVCF